MTIKDFLMRMASENGEPSHKRWIAVTTAAILLWVIVYATLRALNSSERISIIVATMLFILVMAGLATLPQIISLVRGKSDTKDDDVKP